MRSEAHDAVVLRTRRPSACQLTEVQAGGFQNPQQEQQGEVEDQVAVRISENLTWRQETRAQVTVAAGTASRRLSGQTYF